MREKTSEIKTNLDWRINAARLAGASRVYSLSSFKRQLLEIGLARYLHNILPIELEEKPWDWTMSRSN